MSHLTTFQRKLVYAGCILPCLVLMIWLGIPASRDDSGELNAYGKLAQLRQEYELGETSLGNVDPASSTMNLVLLGGRGIATNLLWKQAIEYRDRKQWAQLRSTVDSIILLQPHFVKVWDFQGWNLSYNVSAEWDRVPDRYYWVKEGGKFLMTGSARNRRSPELPYYVGRALGPKVGESDEWKYFRQYFLEDPNAEQFKGKTDPEFNRGVTGSKTFPDNFLAARDWRVEANRRDRTYQPQHIEMLELFRSRPAHSYMEMANALQKEGYFNDEDLKTPRAQESKRTVSARDGWAQGYRDWVNEFGQEEFPSQVGLYHIEITSPDEYENIAQRNSKQLGRTITAADIRNQVNFVQNTTNYRYWRERSRAESQPETAQAHREIYQGQQMYQRGDLAGAQQSLLSGMRKLEELFKKFPEIKEDEELAVEEGLMAMIYLRDIYNLNEQPLPPDLPLQYLWDQFQNSDQLQELYDRFRTQSDL